MLELRKNRVLVRPAAKRGHGPIFSKTRSGLLGARGSLDILDVMVRAQLNHNQVASATGRLRAERVRFGWIKKESHTQDFLQYASKARAAKISRKSALSTRRSYSILYVILRLLVATSNGAYSWANPEDDPNT